MNTNSFADAFPELLSRSRELYGTFSILASVIVFAGLIFAAANGSFGDVNKTFRGVVTATLVVLMIGIFPQVSDLGQDIAYALVEEIGADPSESHQKFANMIAGPEMADGADAGFWDVLWSSEGGFGKAILYAAVLFMGRIAYAIMWLAFLIQNFVILLGVAIAPVFLAMLTLESTRSIAGRYFLTLIAVLCWPVGWAVTDTVTTGLLRMAAGNNVYQAAGESKIAAGTEFLFFIAILSIWIFFSTIAAPYAINKLLVHGAQVGGSLLQSVGMAASQGASYGLGAGMSASLGGSGKLVTGLATAAGAIGGSVSGATGSTGVLIPGMIGMATVAASSSKKPEHEAAEMAEKIRLRKS